MRTSTIRRWALPAVGALALLAGACGSGEPEAGTTADPRTTSASPSPTVSVEDYQAGLTAALGPLAAKLEVIPKSDGLPGLQKRLDRAQDTAAAAAATVEELTPPPNAAAEHDDLIRALGELGSDLGGVSDSVDKQELCAPSSVLSGLGKVGGFSSVPAAMNAFAAKDIKTGFNLPKTPKVKNRRLDNGTFVRAGNRTGSGELQIDNSTESDTVLTLAQGKDPAFTVYVRSGSSYTVDGVRDGTYTIFYSIGQDWDRKSDSFTRNCGFKRFDDRAEFETTYSGNVVYNTIQQVGLQPRIGGNATTSDVDPNDYPG